MRIWTAFFLFFLSTTALNAQSRQDIISQQLDCMSGHLSGGIGWADMCAMSARDEALAAMNAALDDIEYRQITESPPSLTATPLTETIPPRSRHFSQEPSQRKTHTVDFDIERYAFHYKEPTVKMNLRGPMTGFNIAYAYRPGPEELLNSSLVDTYQIQGRLAFGKVDYHGTGDISGKRDRSLELRALAGKEFWLAENTSFMPYLGFGYRSLFVKGSGLSTMVDGSTLQDYDRHSHYFYLPAGMTLGMPINRQFAVDFNLEYDFFLSGYQVSDLDETGLGYPQFRNHQDAGYGLRGALRFKYVTARMNFYIEPFYRYWDIAKSKEVTEAIGTVFEPTNRTHEVGSKFGVQF